MLWAHSGGNAAVGTISNHDFRILAAGEKIRVKTNGNIGIGTSSPSTKLDVRGGHLYVGDQSFANPGGFCSQSNGRKVRVMIIGT